MSGSTGFVGSEAFRSELYKALARKARDKGRPPFDAGLMFKVLVLQARYDLPDEQSEYQILVRLGFMKFLGIEGHCGVPDALTIWLFRETSLSARRSAPRKPRHSWKLSAANCGCFSCLPMRRIVIVTSWHRSD
ncbi:MAG: transposase [Methylocella sp.]